MTIKLTKRTARTTPGESARFQVLQSAHARRFKSNAYIYAQIIDVPGSTIVAVSDIGIKVRQRQSAKLAGETLAKSAKQRPCVCRV